MPWHSPQRSTSTPWNASVRRWPPHFGQRMWWLFRSAARRSAASFSRILREKDAAERLAAERKSHHMRCPKCGGHLHTEAFHGVEVDRCGECHGIWLDHDEIAHLTREENENVLRKVLHDVWASLQKLRAGG